MPTIEDIINGVILREGAPSNDPSDRGGRTQFGISEASNPAAWADGHVTQDEARAIYLSKYVNGPKFDALPDPLRAQMIDFGVTSGPMIAIMKLQEILGVTVDGVLGPQSFTAIVAHDAHDLNRALVGKRVMMIGRLVKKNPATDLSKLVGWLARAIEFL